MQQIKAEAKALHINTGRKTAGPETERRNTNTSIRKKTSDPMWKDKIMNTHHLKRKLKARRKKNRKEKHKRNA